MKKPIYWILISIFTIIFLVSAFFVGRYWIESRNHKNIQKDLIGMRPSVSRPLPTGSSSSRPGSTGTTSSTVSPIPGETTKPTPGETIHPNPPTSTGDPLPPEPEILEELRALYELNNHMVGWIEIPGTENNNQGSLGVYYPVLQTPNTSEWRDYYLYRNFYGEDDNHGWIYVREACDVFAPSDNIVIYGHNMADGTMFGQVVNYRYRSYYEEHKYIYFDTLYERNTYEVIAVFLTSGTTGVGYPYHTKNNFNTEEEFNAFINIIKGGDSRIKIYYNIDATAQYGDKLITLSTCWKEIDDGRLVVVAKRIT